MICIHPVGIPIGNLTSQFFANIYLNGLDHFIKETLGCSFYLRYMDDFMILHDDKTFLWGVKTHIEEYLAVLKLSLHENKCRIFRTDGGVPFLGLTVFPRHRRLKRGNVVRFKRRLKRFRILYKGGAVTWRHVIQSLRSWIGHAMHANTARLRNGLFAGAIFESGEGDRSKG